jgi:hypothetical protein
MGHEPEKRTQEVKTEHSLLHGFRSEVLSELAVDKSVNDHSSHFFYFVDNVAYLRFPTNVFESDDSGFFNDLAILEECRPDHTLRRFACTIG